ncbi:MULTISPECIES: DUF4314 domain-containing protein [Aerococcaceae]|uniref:DUF4314 domain-containing protein n=1 Tax=Hutsoniella sourekii TaxID=87650 RepID=UPI0004B9C825|nr:DUF4314 domain-containing protein [Hutsoniella sourekii]
MNKERLAQIKSNYPHGTRIELLKMDDDQAPPIGTQGIVLAVDDLGSLLVAWDNGSSLNVLDGIDVVRKLDK